MPGSALGAILPVDAPRRVPSGCRGGAGGVRGSMERGSDKHGPLQDDELAKEMDGVLGQGSSNREEWREPEPAVDETDDLDSDIDPITREPLEPVAVDDAGTGSRG